MSDEPMPTSFDGDVDFYEENIFKRIGRRLKDEPLIPVGLAVTCWAFYNASQSTRRGNSVQTNRFFRYRLYAQTFTLVAMIGGSLYYKSDRLKRKEYTKVKTQKEEQEKREQWIRELEIRDQEDQEWRAKLGRVKDLQREEEERMAVLAMQKQRLLPEEKKARKTARKAKKEKEKEKEAEDVPAAVTTPALAKTAAVVESKGQDPKPEKEPYKTILGESEEGGLFGWKHMRGFYRYRMKPAFGLVHVEEDETSGESERGKGSK